MIKRATRLKMADYVGTCQESNLISVHMEIKTMVMDLAENKMRKYFYY